MDVEIAIGRITVTKNANNIKRFEISNTPFCFCIPNLSLAHTGNYLTKGLTK
jgi:hypothetical protein